MPGLTPKQQRFVEEYLIDLNATQAAVRAGYSAKTANEQGSRLLVNVSIAAAIAEAVAARSERTEITADDVLRELALIGFANAGDYFKWGPDGVTLKDSDELTREQQAVVSEVSETVTDKGGTIRLKLHDKKGALVDVGRHLGMFPNKHEMTGKDGGPIETHGSLSDLELSQRLLVLAVGRGQGGAGAGSTGRDGSVGADDRHERPGSPDAAVPGSGESGG